MGFPLIPATGSFENPAVQRYLHDLSSDIGEHITSITSALSLFIEVGKSLTSRDVKSRHPLPWCLGVPAIRFGQDGATGNLLNLSTTATFFSSVTATSLQFSYNNTTGPAANAVNAFWFTSLVFSIGGSKPSVPVNLTLSALYSCYHQLSIGFDLEAVQVVRRLAICLRVLPDTSLPAARRATLCHGGSPCG